MSVREYEANDATALRACVTALQDYEMSINPLTAPPEAMIGQYLRALFTAPEQTCSRVFVKQLETEVIGFVAVQARVANEEPHEVHYHYAYISEIAVLPAYRSRGFGRELLKRAEAFAIDNGAKLLRIGTLWGNTAGYRLYKSLGFEEHAVLLQKELSHDES